MGSEKGQHNSKHGVMKGAMKMEPCEHRPKSSAGDSRVLSGGSISGTGQRQRPCYGPGATASKEPDKVVCWVRKREGR